MDDLARRIQDIEEKQMFDERFAEQLHQQVVDLMRSAEAIGTRLDRLEQRLVDLADQAESAADGADADSDEQ